MRLGAAAILAVGAGACGSHSNSQVALRVEITDLSGGTAGNVLVTGMAGYRASVTRTTTLHVRLGRYRLIARAIPSKGFSYYTQDRIVPFTVNGPRTVVAAYAEQVPWTTKVLNAAKLGLVSGTMATATTLVFTPGTAGARLRPGDVVVVGSGPQTPEGLIRKVLSVGQVADGILVRVALGNLRDAVPRGSFHIHARVDPTAQASLINGPCSRFRHASTFVGADVDASVSAHVVSKIDWDMAWGFLSPNYIKFVASIDAGADLTLDIRASGGCEADADSPSITLPKIPADLGPIPLVVTPKLLAHGELTGTFKQTAAAYAVHLRGSAKAGFTWGTPDGSNRAFRPILSAGAHLNVTNRPQPAVEELYAGAGPQVNFDLDGIDGGPYARLLGGLTVIGTLDSPYGRGTFEGHGSDKIVVGFDLQWAPFISFDVNQSFEFAKHELWNERWTSTTTTPPPTPQSCLIPRGAEGGTGKLLFTTKGLSCAQGRIIVEGARPRDVFEGFDCRYVGPGPPQPGSRIICTRATEEVSWNQIG